MNCNRCGNRLDGSQKFCPVCGAEINKELADNKAGQPLFAESKPEETD